jgi:hypothetical protein
LENAFTDGGVIYTKLGNVERGYRNEKADDQARKRDGEHGMGFVLRYPASTYKNGTPKPTQWIYGVDKWGPRRWVRQQSRAFVWRRESTAANHAGNVTPPLEIVEVDAVYDGRKKKWRVSSDPLETLLI